MQKKMDGVTLNWSLEIKIRKLFLRELPRNMAVLKVRMTFLLASQQAGAFALSPIAGVISQFGLFWPWHRGQRGLKLFEAGVIPSISK